MKKRFVFSFVLVSFIAMLFLVVMTGGEEDEGELGTLELDLGDSVDSVNDYDSKLSDAKEDLRGYENNIKKLLREYESLQRSLDKNVNGINGVLKEIEGIDFANLKSDLEDFNKTFLDKREVIEKNNRNDFLIMVLICSNFCFLLFVVFYSRKS